MSLPVSVIIPFYNGHEYLPRALASVAAQARPPAEIVVVDDGSAEPLREVNVAGRIPLRIVRHEANQGIPHARNTGARAATQPWLAFLDQDDEWLPRRLELQWELIERDGPAAEQRVYFGRALRTAGRGSVAWPRRRELARLVRSPESALRTLLLRGNAVPFITLLVHRAALARVGGFDEARRGGADDYALVLALAAAGIRFCAVAESVARRHETATGFSNAEAFLADDLAIIDALIQQRPGLATLGAASRAAAQFRCARGVSAADPARARALFDAALAHDPRSLRARVGRLLLRLGPRSADHMVRLRDRLSGWLQPGIRRRLRDRSGP